jgi:hypothetical protein
MLLNKYIDLEDKSEVDFGLKYSGKYNIPEDKIGIGEITEYSFGLVKDMQYQMDKGISFNHAIQFFDRMQIKNIGLKDIFILNQSYKYLIKEISRVNEIEGELLASSINSDEAQAGIDDLADLGIYLQHRQLALTFHQTIRWVEEQPYNDMILELVTQKRLNDYERNLWNIRNKSK